MVLRLRFTRGGHGVKIDRAWLRALVFKLARADFVLLSYIYISTRWTS
jgi:hypothetical protein